MDKLALILKRANKSGVSEERRIFRMKKGVVIGQ
jgi:hypothetical protein